MVQTLMSPEYDHAFCKEIYQVLEKKFFMFLESEVLIMEHQVIINTKSDMLIMSWLL